jgi:hypothetical protein
LFVEFLPEALASGRVDFAYVGGNLFAVGSKLNVLIADFLRHFANLVGKIWNVFPAAVLLQRDRANVEKVVAKQSFNPVNGQAEAGLTLHFAVFRFDSELAVLLECQRENFAALLGSTA